MKLVWIRISDAPSVALCFSGGVEAKCTVGDDFERSIRLEKMVEELNFLVESIVCEICFNS